MNSSAQGIFLAGTFTVCSSVGQKWW